MRLAATPGPSPASSPLDALASRFPDDGDCLEAVSGCTDNEKRVACVEGRGRMEPDARGFDDNLCVDAFATRLARYNRTAPRCACGGATARRLAVSTRARPHERPRLRRPSRVGSPNSLPWDTYEALPPVVSAAWPRVSSRAVSPLIVPPFGIDYTSGVRLGTPAGQWSSARRLLGRKKVSGTDLDKLGSF
jgi:hypothetical protein